MEYIILKATMDKLTAVVNEYIAPGYGPQGGVSSLADSWGVQAMLRA